MPYQVYKSSPIYTFSNLQKVLGNVEPLVVNVISWASSNLDLCGYMVFNLLVIYEFFSILSERAKDKKDPNRKIKKVPFTAKLVGFLYFHWSLFYIFTFLVRENFAVNPFALFFIVICTVYYKHIFQHYYSGKKTLLPLLGLSILCFTGLLTGTGFINSLITFYSYIFVYLSIKFVIVIVQGTRALLMKDRFESSNLTKVGSSSRSSNSALIYK